MMGRPFIFKLANHHQVVGMGATRGRYKSGSMLSLLIAAGLFVSFLTIMLIMGISLPATSDGNREVLMEINKLRQDVYRLEKIIEERSIISGVEATPASLPDMVTEECNLDRLDELRHSAIVYTWVNGSEPEYAESRVKHGGKTGGPRDTEHDELRFSLRSLYKFASWLDGPIYLVTPNGHAPSWLKPYKEGAGEGGGEADPELERYQSRITIVDQDTLFPEEVRGVLPTFNTNALEQFLYRIPGLTPVFIHMNDDYLLASQITPQDLFGRRCSGLRLVFEGNTISHTRLTPQEAKKKSWLASTINTNLVLDTVYPTKAAVAALAGEEGRPGGLGSSAPPQRHFLKHAPFVYSRDGCVEVQRLFQADLHTTLTHRFRSLSDVVPPLLHHYYMLYEGGRKFGLEVDLIPPAESAELYKLVYFGDKTLGAVENVMRSTLARTIPAKVITFNDNGATYHPEIYIEFYNFLDKFLPTPSPIERANGVGVVRHHRSK